MSWVFQGQSVGGASFTGLSVPGFYRPIVPEMVCGPIVSRTESSWDGRSIGRAYQHWFHLFLRLRWSMAFMSRDEVMVLLESVWSVFTLHVLWTEWWNVPIIFITQMWQCRRFFFGFYRTAHHLRCYNKHHANETCLGGKYHIFRFVNRVFFFWKHIYKTPQFELLCLFYIRTYFFFSDCVEDLLLSFWTNILGVILAKLKLQARIDK